MAEPCQDLLMFYIGGDDDDGEYVLTGIPLRW